MTDALYTKAKILSDISLDDLRHFSTTVDSEEARVTKQGGGVYHEFRKAKVKLISFMDFPDVCEEILDMIELHRPKLIRNIHEIREFNYLCYDHGGHFIKHKDWLGRENGNQFENRIFSTITLINRSEDLQGGDLYIWEEEKGEPSIIQLDIGETVIFHSMKFHQVTPIVQGTREVLVAWIYLKK